MRSKTYMTYIWILAFLGLFLITPAQSALVGSYVALEPGYPQIYLGDVTVNGNFNFDKQTNVFTMSSEAVTIALVNPFPPPPFNTYNLSGGSGGGYQTTGTVSIDLDNGNPFHGFLVGNLGTLTIQVQSGNVVIGANNYGPGTTLLSGDVNAFGWWDDGSKTIFDFQIKNVSGALVTDSIWPKPNTAPTAYLYAWSDKSWPGSFDNSFTVDKAKGRLGPSDSPPVPVPASLLLLGSGLSLVGFLRLRRKK